MKTLPILFSGPMVLALLDGSKTMTRRYAWRTSLWEDDGILVPTLWQNVLPGDRLWVRERTLCTRVYSDRIDVKYDADGAEAQGIALPERIKKPAAGKRLSMGCYREASRVMSVVKSTKIEPLQDISDEDIAAEGVGRIEGLINSPRVNFKQLWTRLHGLGAWAANPEVVAMGLEVHRHNIDGLQVAA